MEVAEARGCEWRGGRSSDRAATCDLQQKAERGTEAVLHRELCATGVQENYCERVV